jgi:hypothetical protein
MSQGARTLMLILGLVLTFAGASGAVSDPIGMTWFDGMWIAAGIVLMGASLLAPRGAHP